MRWSNGGTLLGALCFLAGALLLLPRRRRTTSSLSDAPVR
jgi:LPXTG-motif cell wall-anchored protein